jgi:hypothetical protein
MKITKSDLRIKTVPFKDFYAEPTAKKQIYLHHTAGGASGEQVFINWGRNPVRVATCVAISADGTIVQGYGSEFWAYHLGLTKDVFKERGIPFTWLDRISIGIEICSYGALTKSGGKYKTWSGQLLDEDQVCVLDKPFRGSKYYQAYTDAQIESVRKLLLFWGDRYGIPLEYRPEIWDIDDQALKGHAGVFTHNSVRRDKSDVYPDPRLIEMLKGL